MRRTVSYYESRIDLSKEQQDAIRARLGASADTFIDAARLAGGEYRNKAAAWSGPSPAQVREAVQRLGAACESARNMITSLPAGAGERIREGQEIDQSRAQDPTARGEPLHPDLARSMETDLDDLDMHLRRIASACQRAAKSSALNTGQGKEPDYARRTLIRELGSAYQAATGKAPARRSNGQFAAVARIILEAAGADTGISNDLLKSIFGAVR